MSIAAAAGGGYYGLSRLWARRSSALVDVIPKFISTPTDQLGAALFDLIAGIGLVVARADGAVTDEERQHLGEHLIEDWGYDSAFVAAALPLVELDADEAAIEGVARAMARLLRDNTDCNAEAMRRDLFAFLRDLAGADGRTDPAERAVIARVEAAFAQEGGWSLLKLRVEAGQAATARAVVTTGDALVTTGNAAGEVLSVAGSGVAAAARSARERIDSFMHRGSPEEVDGAAEASASRPPFL